MFLFPIIVSKCEDRKSRRSIHSTVRRDREEVKYWDLARSLLGASLLDLFLRPMHSTAQQQVAAAVNSKDAIVKSYKRMILSQYLERLLGEITYIQLSGGSLVPTTSTFALEMYT